MSAPRPPGGRPDAPPSAAPADAATRVSSSGASGISSYSRPPPPGPATLEEGEVLAERYRILQRLGKGGMGEVYLAEHVTIGRKVAVKTLSAHLHDKPEVAERFLQEARTSSLVRHSNIVDIIDFGHTPRGAPYFVMEYLEGEDLKTVLRREGVLPWERSREILLQVCAALSAAHAQGVVHRDLKPDNIYLVRQGAQELVKVLDFGIAKVVSAEPGEGITQTGVLLGTPEFMSPEQAHDLPLDARSDVYALGVLLYRMCTGRLPFRAKSFMTVLAMHMHEAPPPPSAVDPTRPVTPGQEALILRCLAKRPEDRPASADEVAAAIKALDSRPAAAALPAQPAPPSRRWIGVAIGGVGTAAALIMGVILLLRPPAPEATPAPAPAPVVAPLSPPPEPPAPDKPATPPVPEDTEPEPPPEIVDEELPPLAPEVEPAGAKKARGAKALKGAPKTGAPVSALSDAHLRSAAAGVSLDACAELGLPGSTYKVDVEVDTGGKVTSAVAHKPARGSELGTCVEKAARRARFPALVSPQRATLSLRM